MVQSFDICMADKVKKMHVDLTCEDIMKISYQQCEDMLKDHTVAFINLIKKINNMLRH